MNVERTIPVSSLRDHVRCFEQREADVDAVTVYPIAARPDQILEFYLRDRYLVRECQSGAEELAPRAVVVGPSTFRRAELVLHGWFDVFTIHFQASGLHRLFRMPMRELVDCAYDARSVVGPIISEVEERLADASTFPERTRIATNFLLHQLGDRRVSVDAVALVANRFLWEQGAIRVDSAAASAGMSARQFERRFVEQVGLSPKRYARIVRFNAALRAKQLAPERSWTDIAHALGFYDQMHMVHDFRRFTGESPAGVLSRFTAMPEPWA